MRPRSLALIVVAPVVAFAVLQQLRPARVGAQLPSLLQLGVETQTDSAISPIDPLVVAPEPDWFLTVPAPIETTSPPTTAPPTTTPPVTAPPATTPSATTPSPTPAAPPVTSPPPAPQDDDPDDDPDDDLGDDIGEGDADEVDGDDD